MRSKLIAAVVVVLAISAVAAMKAAPAAKPPGFDVDKFKFSDGLGHDGQDASIPSSWKLVSVVPLNSHVFLWFQDADGSVYVMRSAYDNGRMFVEHATLNKLEAK